jgi:hypothetical protein
VSPSDRTDWQVSGHPTDAELVAVVAALTAQAAAVAAASVTSAPPSPATSGWSAYWRGLRRPLPAGWDAWRASGQPRT